MIRGRSIGIHTLRIKSRRENRHDCPDEINPLCSRPHPYLLRKLCNLLCQLQSRSQRLSRMMWMSTGDGLKETLQRDVEWPHRSIVDHPVGQAHLKRLLRCHWTSCHGANNVQCPLPDKRRKQRPSRHTSSHNIHSQPHAPVSMRSMARERPIRRGRRTVPPSISGTPKRRQKTPKVALRATMRRSHRSASSSPPATAWPSTAAMQGLLSAMRVGPMGPCPLPIGLRRAAAAAAPALPSAFKSYPLQNVPLAPCRTPTWTVAGRGGAGMRG